MKISKILETTLSAVTLLSDDDDLAQAKGIAPLIINGSYLSRSILNGSPSSAGSLSFSRKDIRKSFLPNKFLRVFKCKKFSLFVGHFDRIDISRVHKHLTINVPFGISKRSVGEFIYEYLDSFKLPWFVRLALSVSSLFAPNLTRFDSVYDRETQLKIYITLGILRLIQFDEPENFVVINTGGDE